MKDTLYIGIIVIRVFLSFDPINGAGFERCEVEPREENITETRICRSLFNSQQSQ